MPSDLTHRQIDLLRKLSLATDPVAEMTVRFSRIPRAYFQRHGSTGERGRAFYSITDAGRLALANADI